MKLTGARILIIDFAYQNINRTVMLWQLAWRQLGEVSFFGPGHVSDQEWTAGLKSYLDKHGKFDVIVSAELLVSALNTENSISVVCEQMDVTYECPFDILGAVKGCRRIYEEWLEVDTIRVLSMLEFDSFNMYESHYQRIYEGDFYVVGWGEEFVRKAELLPDLPQEEFYDSANDRWWNFVTTKKHRVISSPAMVSEDEFYWATLGRRYDRWAVQGARYAARLRARKVLSRSGVKWTGTMLARAISAIGFVNSRMLRWPLVRTTLNHIWQQGFRNSRFAYTCGSALGYPIRKFFEIPAAGAVLVAQAPNGFEDLGFKHKENAFISSPERLPTVDTWLKSNLDEAQRIATAGRDLVWEQHRVGARARQYTQVIEAIASGCFRGSRWRGGAFEIMTL